MKGGVAMMRLVARELIDDPDVDRAALVASARGIEASNRRFGGHAVVLRELDRLRRAGVPVERLVDVGAGFGDLAEAVVSWGRRYGCSVEVLCIDHHPTILDLARKQRGTIPGVTFIAGEGCSLPLQEHGADVALSTLTLHHLEPCDAVVMLRELRRVSRATPIVADLVRGVVPYVLVWLWSRLLARDRLNRHDGPLSVRRAYTPREALALAREAGWHEPRVRVTGVLRMVLTDG
ncbi:methyltransferase domain-containing protein [bacterium]|nr:MAG: methyltransferase domain-containing protein [bacterium]